MSTKLIFVRHGHSEANLTGFWAGRVDVALTETGVKQAKKVSEYILKKYNIDAVYASTLQRAYKTAEEIAQPLGLTVNKDERLCEIYGGDWEKLTFEYISREFPEQFELWKNDMSKVRTPNGEDVYDVQKRGLEAIKKIANANEGKTVVIVSHRVMLRTIQCEWEKRPLEKINECEWLQNCSVSEVIYDNGSMYPIDVGQIQFMGELETKINTIM